MNKAWSHRSGTIQFAIGSGKHTTQLYSGRSITTHKSGPLLQRRKTGYKTPIKYSSRANGAVDSLQHMTTHTHYDMNSHKAIAVLGGAATVGGGAYAYRHRTQIKQRAQAITDRFHNARIHHTM